MAGRLRFPHPSPYNKHRSPTSGSDSDACRLPPFSLGHPRYDGHFRTALKRITSFIDPETGETTYSATLEVAWEPTLQPFFLESQPQDLAVIDDQTQKPLPPISLGHAKMFVFRQNAKTLDPL